MVPVSIRLGAGKPRYEHIRTERPNHPHHISQRDLVSAPLRKGLLRALGKSKVGYARESLLDTVILVRCQQFFRAQHAQHIRQIASYLVLAALAAIQRHQQHAGSATARFERQHPAIFIIGMRYCLHQPRRRAEPPQHPPQADDSLILRKFGRRSLIGKQRKVGSNGWRVPSLLSRRYRARRALLSPLE